MSMMNSNFAMKSVLMLGVAAVGMMMASGGASAQTRADGYTFTPINAPLAGTAAGQGTVIRGVNGAGQMVGWYATSSNSVNGFVDTNGTFTTIDVPGATMTEAYGINNAGQITGYYVNSSGTNIGFLDTNGTFSNVWVSGSSLTQPTGINNSGQITGRYDFGTSSNGFVDTNGAYTGIALTAATFAEGINDAWQVAGFYNYQRPGDQGFVDTNGTFKTIDDPLGTSGTRLLGINNAGQVVGYYWNSSGIYHGFLDTDGTFTTIDDPLGTEQNDPTGITASGVVVGAYQDSSGVYHGYVATPDNMAPLPAAGGTLPGSMVLLGWLLGRRLTVRRREQKAAAASR